MSEALVGTDRDASEDVPSNAELAKRLSELESKHQVERERRIEAEQRAERAERAAHSAIAILRTQLKLDDHTTKWNLVPTTVADVIQGRATDYDVEKLEERIIDLGDDVEKLKRGEVDPTDVVASFEPELPIEEDVAKAMDDVMSSDLSANEKRAVHIFRAFGGRSRKYNGTLKVESGDVRNILEEKGEKDPNPNTVKRAMKMAAKKTSGLQKGDRDAYDSDNLLTLHKAKNCLELRADSSEWDEYIEEVEDRVER